MIEFQILAGSRIKVANAEQIWLGSTMNPGQKWHCLSQHVIDKTYQQAHGRVSLSCLLIRVKCTNSVYWSVISETFPQNIAKNSNTNAATKIHLSNLNASSDRLFNEPQNMYISRSETNVSSTRDSWVKAK